MIAARLMVALAVGLWSPAATAAPSVYPTGTTIYEPARAHAGFVLFSALDGRTRLIDMSGREVRRWDKVGDPSRMIDPRLSGGERGRVLVQLSHDPHPAGWAHIYANRTIGELDWEGRVVWEWGRQAPSGAARQSHEIERLANGHTRILSKRRRMIAGLGPRPVVDDVIYEINRAGEIVWSWSALEHLREFGLTPEGLAMVQRWAAEGDTALGVVHLNSARSVGANRWYDAGDERFHPDNLVISSREFSVVAIVSRASGLLVWRLGPDYPILKTGNYHPFLPRNVPRPVDQTSGQHDAQLIAKGLPGAGNLLLFDNEAPSGFPPSHLGVDGGARILEIDPVSMRIVWQYTGMDSAEAPWTFHSAFLSSVSRLPNGNTLIAEGASGRLFQVTTSGELVWEYVSPYFGPMEPGQSATTNAIYRAQLVPYDWAPVAAPHAMRRIPRIDRRTFRVPGGR